MMDLPWYVQIFFAVIGVSFVLSIIIQTYVAYRQYKRIKLSFENMTLDMDEKLEAFYSKHEGQSNPQLDQLRDQYSEMKRAEYREKGLDS